jgi:hypothetical protein
VTKLNERRNEWKQLKRYFKKNYLSEQFYNKKLHELQDLKQGQMSTNELKRKFIKLFKNVKFVKDEKMKISYLLCTLNLEYRNKVQMTSLEPSRKHF